MTISGRCATRITVQGTGLREWKRRAIHCEVSIVLITGIQAAGESSVSQRLAERLPRSVHVRGDVFRRFVVNGRSEMGAANPPAEAVEQLRLRYRLAAMVAQEYAAAGFNVVLQDIAIADDLTYLVDQIEARPLHILVLAPSAATVVDRDRQRQAERGKVAYKEGDETIHELDRSLRLHTPRLGYWIDTSSLTVDETVDTIVRELAITDSAFELAADV